MIQPLRRDTPTLGMLVVRSASEHITPLPTHPSIVPGSNFKFDADFHDLPARNFEICARALGVVMHQGEERLGPSRQAGAAGRE